MDLQSEILREHSKAQCTKLVKWIGNNQQRFDALFKLFLHGEYRIQQRAAWPLGYAVTAHPALISRNWKKLILKLKQPGLHNSIKRNGVRLMQDIDIPEKHHGEVMDICFTFLESPSEPLAVKVFSMTVLAKLACNYPEIVPEIKLLIEDQLPNQTPGFKSRAKKILKAFNTSARHST